MKPASTFTKKLSAWYYKNKRDLPWRKTADPYKIWISEIMLQQTTVNTVIAYYVRWIREFPTVQSVAKAPLQRILKMWQGLGYYSRAKNIHRSAKIVCDVYGGRIPDNPEELKKLPGIGPYTVGAVSSIAFGRKYPIIDANVRRVIMRQLALKGHADNSQDKKVLNFLEKVMPARNAGIFNQALMELGALICRSREPNCISCPVKMSCRGYKKGIQEIIPLPKKTVFQKIQAVIAIIERNGRFFIQKRPARGLLADLWEFPGGKVEAHESIEEALHRELKEELGVTVEKMEYLMDTLHFYTQFRVQLHVWRCHLVSYPKIDQNHKWVSFKSLERYPMPSGSAKIVEQLRELETNQARGAVSNQRRTRYVMPPISQGEFKLEPAL